MMMFVVWGMLCFFAGVAIYLVMPWTTARIAGDEYAEQVAKYYVWLAQGAVVKSAIVERDGILDLVRKKYDADMKGDKDSTHGDRHHRDGFDVLNRLSNKSFGLALSDRGEYVSPLLAELGGEFWRAREDGDIGTVIEHNGDEYMKDGVIVDDRSKLVDLADAKHLTSGSASPESGADSKEKTKISQEKFHQKLSFGQQLTVALTFSACFAVVFAALVFGPSVDDGGAATDAGNQTVVSFLFLAYASPWLLQVGRFALAGLWALVWVLLIPVTAFFLLSPMWAIVATFLTWTFAIAIPAACAFSLIPHMFGASLAVARINWILAQLANGAGCLIRRESGEYEYARLRDLPEDVVEQRQILGDYDLDEPFNWYVQLNGGTRLGVDGSRGDLYRFGWAPLGITEEKGPENLGAISETPNATVRSDGGEDARTHVGTSNRRPEGTGYRAYLPVPKQGEWMVAGPQLASWCRNTAESVLIERGRDQALRDYGGQQQMGDLWFVLIVLMAAVFGGGMGLVAGGGI